MNYTNYLKKNKCVIFLFHGVLNKDNDKLLNCVKKHISRNKFLKIIRSLSAKGTSLNFDEYVYYSQIKKKFPKYSFLITFDDGFYNNFKIAAPILKKYNTKAIFYLTTNFIDKNYMSWTDRIDYAVKKSRRGEIKIGNKKLSFTNKLKSKINFVLEIRNIVKNDLSINSENFADKLQKNLINKTIKTSNLNIYKKMSWSNINKLLRNNLFSVGGHSHNHETLTKLSESQLNREIKLSLRCIRIKCNQNTVHYAYPDGLKSSFNSKVIKVLKKNKIISCPTALHGINSAGDNLFKLKRVFVK